MPHATFVLIVGQALPNDANTKQHHARRLYEKFPYKWQWQQRFARHGIVMVISCFEAS